MREEQKHRQKKGRQGLPLTAAFLGFLAVFGAGLAFLPEKVFSDTENRYLAQKPEWTAEAFLDGSYGEDYEKYLSDQFPMRGSLVALKTLAQRSAGKGDVNGVYFGKDGYYIERFDREKFINGQLQKNIGYLEKAVSSFVGSLGKMKEGAKIGIILGISMICSFLAGLMNSNMKDIVEKHAPFINRINPAALISDAFYCINVYDDTARYHRSLITLAAMSLVLVIVSFLLIRRERYDSI